MATENIYRFKFSARCPADGANIEYAAEICANTMIRVESIHLHLTDIKEGFQEELADAMHAAFGGKLSIRGVHQGIEILSLRG